MPSVGNLFLNLHIRRTHIVQDSLTEVGLPATATSSAAATWLLVGNIVTVKVLVCVLPLLPSLPSPPQLIMKRHDLKKKVKVTFAGEPGLDWGGLTKEWFLLLVRKIFQPDFGEWLGGQLS